MGMLIMLPNWYFGEDLRGILVYLALAVSMQHQIMKEIGDKIGSSSLSMCCLLVM